MVNIKFIIAIFISVLPLNILRVFAYQKIFNYKISESKIGFGTLILVDHYNVYRVKIGNFNQFIGPMKVEIKENTSIYSFNRFICGEWANQNKKANFERYLKIGENCTITTHHFFDIVGSVVIGKNSWIAGRGSQFWTHGPGASANDRNIKIGKCCYVGSAVRFTPGSNIGNNVLVGLGSTVTKKFNVNKVMIAGAPAIVIKENYDWNEY